MKSLNLMTLRTALLTPRNDVEGAVRSLPYRTIRTLLYIWIG